ncbi:MAG: glycosyltransferase family 2 protein [Selenomonadaceae bacterium]|nr:glycosyltransferase family 2 protein [Selenomonadaceae bacterium]MBR4382150.1 glycosyltransferase family 2 protein [Selenomonadaceae bacterium]
MKKIPAISVIIPMYNAEKYIGECLAGILAQTFQDFEVIVVNDCSTDSSVAVVEGYKKFFGERLKIARTKKNSGNPGVPSNMGIRFSRGEYLLILDNDDAITPTALEELYTTAKKFDADVVACEKYFTVPDELWNKNFLTQILAENQKNISAHEAILISEDISERLAQCMSGKNLWPLWAKLIRRDALTENHIQLVDSVIQDLLATLCLLLTVKKYVCVSNVVNFYRVRKSSLYHQKYTPQNYFRKYFRSLRVGFDYFDKFLGEREFFRQHSDLKYKILSLYFDASSDYLEKIYGDVSIYELDEILREEFGNGDNRALSAFIFNISHLYRLQLKNLQPRIEQE